jgi:hypothetical protein
MTPSATTPVSDDAGQTTVVSDDGRQRRRRSATTPVSDDAGQR